MENMKHTRKINLRDGGALEIECSDELYAAVRAHYKISDNEEISDHTLKTFITTMCKNAVENAEREYADKSLDSQSKG